MDLPCCFRLCSVELNLDLLYSSDNVTVCCVDQMAEVEHRVLVAEERLMGESTLHCVRQKSFKELEKEVMLGKYVFTCKL